ncbi:MAG: sigma 54-interacting transcriptional regulator [Planctomycetes bacterium]|nr:sigma 54-interacting transcriptional regulator [Planctomycetota bacterium]
MMARIIAIEGPDAGREFDLTDLPLTIGRDPSNGIALTDESVSRVHARIERRDGRLWISDEGSRNGTFLNGMPVEASEIAPDDRIGIGDTELRYVGEPTRLEFPPYETTIIRRSAGGADPVKDLANGAAAAVIERLRALHDIAREIESAERAADVLETALGRLRNVLEADRAAAIRFQGDRFELIAHTGGRRQAAFPVSRGVLDEVRGRGEALLCRDVASNEALAGRESIVASRAVSLVAVPLRAGESVWGALYLERTAGAFDDEDLYTAAAAASIAGPAYRARADREAVAAENRVLVDALLEERRIVGDSPAMRAVLSFIGKAAPTDSTVLILGETGTGKELVASAIHFHGPRRGKPLVVVNCAALPENLVESELFGHEKGAFTGAFARKKGKFELADGGTVFLDEIAELAPACQAKLLRLLEDRKLERVGGTESIPVDVRIIAATNRNLEEEIAGGGFRADLFYRLNVLSVTLPPLRARPEDIPPLVDHFLVLFGRKAPGGPMGISRRALDRLATHTWPGNVRELRNVIERSVVFAAGPAIEAEDLLLGGVEPARPVAVPAESPGSLLEVEREHILRALAFTKGNKKKAAEILGIERCTLYSKIKAHGIDSEAIGKERD